MPRMAAYDRQDCLEKAVTLFWEKGFHATSLKDIEHALDMRPGSIYAAFGNKESLYSQALDLYAGTMGKDFLDNLSSKPPLKGWQSICANWANCATPTRLPGPACW